MSLTQQECVLFWIKSLWLKLTLDERLAEQVNVGKNFGTGDRHTVTFELKLMASESDAHKRNKKLCLRGRNKRKLLRLQPPPPIFERPG